MRTAWISALTVLAALGTGLGACSSSSSGGGSGGGSGTCDQHSGGWSISGTCSASSCTLTQNGCSFTMPCSDGTTYSGSFSGSTISFSAGNGVSCSGSLSGSTSASGHCNSPQGTCNWTATQTSSGSGGSGGGGGKSGSGGSGFGGSGTGGSGFGGSGAGGSGGGGGDACTTCLQSSCASQVSACGANAECQAILDCVGTCNNDSTCIQNCQSAHPNGQSDLAAVITCMQTNCKTPCGL